MAFFFLLSSAWIFLATFVSAAQPASFAIPPLQWLNLANTFNGDAPPPLAYASIGYDPQSNTIIVYGGEQNGIPQSTTYLLDLTARSWSRPSPPPSLTRFPPARSRAISGVDFAVNNRHGFVVIGGKGADNMALSDVWEFDFLYSFWSEVKVSSSFPHPSRWGAVGGIDPRVLPVQDTVLPGPNNTLYLAGGTDEKEQPLSPVWALSLSGTLSPNLPDSVSGSWASRTIDGNLPSPLDQTGTIIGQRVVSIGTQYARVVDALNKNSISPEYCPAPRTGVTVVPNLSTSSTGFATQAFVLLGLLNATLWDDGGGLQKGEVDIIEVQTGSWSRVLPAGDPTSGTSTFPSPREGAVAVSLTRNLANNQAVTDTFVFGGRNEKGYLDEIWLLRAYDGSVNPGSPRWSGYGNGQLQSGIGATGSGVAVQYLTECAKPAPSAVPPPTDPGQPQTPPPSDPPPPMSPTLSSYDTSIAHKIFGPVSVALIFPAFHAFMLAQVTPQLYAALSCISMVVGVFAFGSGITGFILSFTSLHSSVAEAPRHLMTAHGQAGMVLFILTYIIMPLLFAITWRKQLFPRRQSRRQSSIGILEKPSDTPHTTTNVTRSASPEAPSRSRAPSSFSLNLRQRAYDSPPIDSGDTETSLSHTGTFVVTNRPRRASTGWLNFNTAQRPNHQRNLSDLSWLDRRRSLNAVNETDYTQTIANGTSLARTPATADLLIEPTTRGQQEPLFTCSWKTSLFVLFQALLLGLCVLTLIMLWRKAPYWAFGVFLAWIVAFYILCACLALRIRRSLLLERMKHPESSGLRTSERDSYPFPSSSPAGSSANHLHMLRTPDTNDTNDDEELDEETRQTRIEQEMDRRDVSIITVPKQNHRPLRVTNLP